MDSIEWMRDGSSLLDRDSASIGPLVLTDTSTASYVNTLEVSSRLPGTYTCLIRGPDDEILSSMDVVVNGINTFNLMIMIVTCLYKISN